MIVSVVNVADIVKNMTNMSMIIEMIFKNE
ncbi:Protein of unknown function [Bacillus mycoides]|uniref:Uncharacterized protein n=1 Tax=Bacillus mycoides TaxID=1405 RepID=A0A1G4F011_BACMY|nr:Protein of unknown function [Bacillus mycoides]